MKTKLLFIGLAFLIQTAFSQCVESVTNFGNNTNTPIYNVSGAVSVSYNTDASISLTLGSDFETAWGPDVRAYLINSNGKSNSEIANEVISAFDYISFGTVEASGSQSFTQNIPSTFNISNFDKVLFYCLAYDVFWDVGSYTSFTASNCPVLSIEDNILKRNISIFPNPANEQFEVLNALEAPLSIVVYDMFGKQLLAVENTPLKKQAVSLSGLNSGVYLVEIKSDKQSITKKIIKR